MYSDLLALAGTATIVAVWAKGGFGIVSLPMNVTVQASSTASKLVLSDGSTTWTWDANDVAGFAR